MGDTRITDRLALGIALVALLLAGCSHEAADWKQAGLANTAEAYQLFVQQHPRSPEAAQAQARIKQLDEQRDWQVAGAADTRDAYQQFVTQHPDSKWAQEARIRIENFAQAGVSSGAALASVGNAPASGAGANAEQPAQPTPKPASAAPSQLAPRRPSSRHAAPPHVVSAPLARERTGGPLVQLGAFRSKARAESEWKLLSARFSTLKSLQPRYVPTRSRGGQIYRLQVHVSSAAAANGLCATLKKHARPCMRITA